MQKIKRYLSFIIFGAIIVFVGALIYAKNQPRVILFYGATCPHCKIVEEYIDANNIRAKIKFEELEVYNNKKNATLLGKYAEQCGIDATAGVGVPFFFDGQKCFLGDKDIIDYFKTK